MLSVEFKKFRSIPRLERRMVVTEKIDGTSSQLYIKDREIICGSRNRWITTEDDNHGFAKWVEDNRIQIIDELGEGQHFGEFWGGNIQRGYGVKEKSFSLFSYDRYKDLNLSLCKIVPVLYEGDFNTFLIDEALKDLSANGSRLNKDFKNSEGVVVFHEASKQMFKKTLDNNDGHKSLTK
jgi:hypothetical protein